MKLVWIYCFLAILLGCSSQKKEVGPLSNFQDFEVFILLSPFENFEKKELCDFIVENLNRLGEVKYVEKIDKPSKNTPVLLFSIGGYKAPWQGSISLLDEVVAENGFHLACQIWKVDYNGENLPYPILEDQKIAFKKDEEITNINKDDPKFTVQRLIAIFSEKFHNDNNGKLKPIFYLVKNEACSFNLCSQ